jgi:Ras-related C3 botulinum toxin substrate 1
VNIKLVLVGDGSSGKTSLLVSYATDMFNQDYIPTVMESHEATIRKGQDIVKLQIYDTAGQD